MRASFEEGRLYIPHLSRVRRLRLGTESVAFELSPCSSRAGGVPYPGMASREPGPMSLGIWHHLSSAGLAGAAVATVVRASTTSGPQSHRRAEMWGEKLPKVIQTVTQ